MPEIINDFTIRVATVNGSGSQSSNNILLKALFYMGLPVAGKNIFPSNIAGLPTWYNIRVSKEGYIGTQTHAQVLVLMNPETFEEDIQEAKPGAAVIYQDKLAPPPVPSPEAIGPSGQGTGGGVGEGKKLRDDLIYYPCPFQKLVNECCEAAKLRKMVINMVYVGVAAQLLQIDEAKVRQALEKQFEKKPKVVDLNWKAIQAGLDFAKKNLTKKDPYKVAPLDKIKNKILITGNEACALGCLFGGCTVFTWYPITPASSLGEAVMDYFARFRRENETPPPVPSPEAIGPLGQGTGGGENGNRARFAVVQAEDELAALGMAIGAGWAGARSATSTSGPGISLMAEFAGLAYFTEVPTVIFDVQRLGPSTGLPTRTSQGDIIFTQFLSHGDTKHLAVIPATPEECFDLTQEAFNLAEEYQTLVFVMSDLDLGMNNWMSEPFAYPKAPFRRGKVLTKEKLEKLKEFHRYADPDGDGVSWRTLPGTKHPLAGYFTRGSGHTARATYSEKPADWTWVLDKIARKVDRAKEKLPAPVVEEMKGAKTGLIAYGSSHGALVEARDRLATGGLKAHYLRLRSLPLHGRLEKFVQDCDRVYVVDQNQQGQMANLIKMTYPQLAPKLRKILHYNGMPIDAETIVNQVMQWEKNR